MKTTFPKTLAIAAVLTSLTLALEAQQAPQQDLTKPTQERGKMETRDHSGNVHAQDGILRSQGSMMFLKEGKLSRVTYEMKLSEGMTVRPNGEVVLKDGKTVTLQEGQMLTLDGQVTQAPKSLGSTAPGSSGTTVQQKGSLTDFGQSGSTGPKVPATK